MSLSTNSDGSQNQTHSFDIFGTHPTSAEEARHRAEQELAQRNLPDLGRAGPEERTKEGYGMYWIYTIHTEGPWT
jgi:hypothetical protein